MAQGQGQQGGGKSRNRNRGGGGSKCPLCPDEGRDGQQGNPQPNTIPSGRSACLACIPEKHIAAVGVSGKDNVIVTVIASENGGPCNTGFLYAYDGVDDWIADRTDDKGIAKFTVPFADRKGAKLRVVSGGTDDRPEVSIPTKDEAEKSSAKLPEGAETDVEVFTSHDRARVLLIVKTLVNGKLAPLDFMVQWYHKEVTFHRSPEKTWGKNRKGVAVIPFPVREGTMVKRTAVVSLLDAKGVKKETFAPLRLTDFHEPELGECETLDFVYDYDHDDENSCFLVHVDTYKKLKDERLIQVGARFSYKLDGQKRVFLTTSDAVSSSEPAGTCTFEVPYTGKRQTLKLSLHGVKADTKDIRLPPRQRNLRKPVDNALTARIVLRRVFRGRKPKQQTQKTNKDGAQGAKKGKS